MGLGRGAWIWFGLVWSFFSLSGMGVGHAGDLGSSKITAVRNSVEHNDGQGKKPADVGLSVTQGQSVLTKEQSLAELVAEDSSIIRLGANSVFSYSSKERLVKLDKGTMLMHTPPGNGGATIDSGGVVGAISGTTFMLTASPAKCAQCGHELDVQPNGKILCRDHPELPPSNSGFALIVLEGGSVTKVTGPDGQTVSVSPGQMAVVGPKGSGAPKVYAVNVAQIARTSPLINAFPNPLPSFPKIITTAYGLQGYNPSTGTSAVALGSGGQLLTAVSPLPNPYQISFPMAFNQPGLNNFINNSNLGNIATAAGGGSGGPATPTGVAGGGGGSFGPVLPTIPVPPPNNGQQAIPAGGSTQITQLTVGGASVVSKVYDGTKS
ncbi:MAG: hypothetical protein EBT57_09860, partial [Verrucomicrobia bacterium]|nr:hypothetical protein [Verrucomicrobiota bacterium]